MQIRVEINGLHTPYLLTEIGVQVEKRNYSRGWESGGRQLLAKVEL